MKTIPIRDFWKINMNIKHRQLNVKTLSLQLV